jgi:hypothetical protein
VNERFSILVNSPFEVCESFSRYASSLLRIDDSEEKGAFKVSTSPRKGMVTVDSRH